MWFIGMYDKTVGGLVEEQHESLALAKVRCALFRAEADCIRNLQGSDHCFHIYLQQEPITPPPPDGITIPPGGPRVVRFILDGVPRREVHPHFHSYDQRLKALRVSASYGEDIQEIVGEHVEESKEPITGVFYYEGVHQELGVKELGLSRAQAYPSPAPFMPTNEPEPGTEWVR